MIDSQPATPSRLERLDNWGLRAITGGALLFALMGIVTLVLRAVDLLTSSSVNVNGLQLATGQTPELAAASPAIVEAHYDSVTLVIDGLPAGVRWLMVSETAVQSLLSIGLCVIVFILGMALLDRRPFARSATIAIFSAAILVMVTGMLAPFLGSIADAETVRFLGDAVIGHSASDPAAETLRAFSMILDPAPLGWGFALAIVASAFQLGQRMQRDTQGLV